MYRETILNLNLQLKISPANSTPLHRKETNSSNVSLLSLTRTLCEIRTKSVYLLAIAEQFEVARVPAAEVTTRMTIDNTSPPLSRKRPSETRVLGSSNHNTTPANAVQPAEDGPHVTVKINRIQGVAQWSWNANDDVCGICHAAFEGTAPGVRFPGEDSPGPLCKLAFFQKKEKLFEYLNLIQHLNLNFLLLCIFY